MLDIEKIIYFVEIIINYIYEYVLLNNNNTLIKNKNIK